MISAFGIDHGVIAKAAYGEYGFTSEHAHARTKKKIVHGSRMKARHGNPQRMAFGTGLGTALGTGLGAAEGGMAAGGKGALIGAGLGAGAGAALGAVGAKGENMERSASREIGPALKRGDVRRLKSGERTTSYRNLITKD